MDRDEKPMKEQTFDITVGKRRFSKRFEKERFPGFAYSGTQYKPRWSRKRVSAAETELLRQRAAEDRLVFDAVPSQYTRSSNYREVFLAAEPGPWRCRYCHKRLHEGMLTVDHIVPVAAASRSNLARKALTRMGAESVNDIANLAPACPGCNSRKGSKGGLWIVRGVLGKESWYWVLVWIARVVGLALICWLAWKFLLATPTAEMLLKKGLALLSAVSAG